MEEQLETGLMKAQRRWRSVERRVETVAGEKKGGEKFCLEADEEKMEMDG